MSEPFKRIFSEAELTKAVLEWMKTNHSQMLVDDPDKFHARLGLLFDFVTDLMKEKDPS